MRVCLYVFMGRDDQFQALANRHRRAILRLVRDQPLSVGSLTEQLGLSQPAVSQHLAVLRSAGLVTVRADGRRRWYAADLGSLAEARSFFDEYWSGAVDRLTDVAERSARGRRAAS